MEHHMSGEHSTVRRNNYIDYSSFPFPFLSMIKHVDLFTLSVKDGEMVGVLNSNFKLNGFKVKDYALKKGNYKRKREYWSDEHDVKVNLFYKLKSERSPLPAIRLDIHDPDLEFMDFMKSTLSSHKIDSNLSKVELAFDFYTDDLWSLFLFFKAHLYLKCQRSKPKNYYDTTFYTNDIRKSLYYGVKAYIRASEKLVRVELTLKSKSLRQLGINSLLEGVECIDLANYFSFKVFDEKRLRDYLLGKCRQDIEAANKRRLNGGGLIIAQIDGWLRSVVNGQDSLMSMMELLKSEKGISRRCFSDFEEMNDAFIREVSKQTFIKSRHLV